MRSQIPESRVVVNRCSMSCTSLLGDGEARKQGLPKACITVPCRLKQLHDLLVKGTVRSHPSKAIVTTMHAADDGQIDKPARPAHQIGGAKIASPFQRRIIIVANVSNLWASKLDHL